MPEGLTPVPEEEQNGETPKNLKQEMEGTDLQKRAQTLEDELTENSRQRQEAWGQYSRNKSDEVLRQTYESLESKKEEMQSESWRVTDAMGEREYFAFERSLAGSKERVDNPELAQEIAKKVKGLRDRSRELLDRAEKLSQDPSKHNKARMLTHKALILEFQAGGKEERMIADRRNK